MRVVAPSVLALVAGLLFTASASAETLVGLTMDGQLLGVNIEYTGSAGSAYVLIGSYEGAGGFEITSLTGIVGLRRFQGGKFDQNGYFGGIFIGDVAGSESTNRYGAGGELGYQWLTEHLRTTLHGGVALVGEASGDGAIPSTSGDIQPATLLGASVSLRF